MPFTILDEGQIVQTIERLHSRIRERFPDASLTKVAAELEEVGRQHAAISRAIHSPNWWLRSASIVALLLGIGALILLFASVRAKGWPPTDVTELLGSLDSGLSMLFLLAATAILLTSFELRRKRSRCIEALHKLRALAHIVDMHQLTKDPEHAINPRGDTSSSPRRLLSPFELTRYLDYCSEMLALLGKLAALYAQSFPDPAAVAAVDAIEDLTTGLSRKVWQKIMILANHPDADAPDTPQ